MKNIVKSIQNIYPEIKGGFIYWHSKYDGTPLDKPEDGLRWDNPSFAKPSWDMIKQHSDILDLKETKDKKELEIDSKRDAELAKNILQRINNVDCYFQRDIASNLAWHNAIQGMKSDDVLGLWVVADNSIVEVKKSDFINICAHIQERDTREIIQARLRKNAVNALTTIEEVEAFDITQVFEV